MMVGLPESENEFLPLSCDFVSLRQQPLRQRLPLGFERGPMKPVPGPAMPVGMRFRRKNPPRRGGSNPDDEQERCRAAQAYLSRATTKSGAKSRARLNSESGNWARAWRLCSA